MNRFTLPALLLIFLFQAEATFPNGFLFSSLIASSTPAPSGEGASSKGKMNDELDNPSLLIDLLLDITNETDVTPIPSLMKDEEAASAVDSDVATDSSNIESITVAPSDTLSPKTVCIKSSSVVLFRYFQRKLRHLIITTLDFVAFPLELLRDLLNIFLVAFTDGLFTLLGYHEPICRQQVICKGISFIVYMMPNWLRSTFERNWQPLARLANRLNILDSDSELVEALVTGALDGNCTSVYTHKVCP